MKKIGLFIIVMITGFTLIHCSGNGSASQQDTQSNGIPVKTMLLKQRPFSEYLKLTGTVEARNRINLVAEESGNLRKIIRDKGSLVKAGDTLAIIENKIIEASYNESRAALNQAELDHGSKKVLYEKRAISENEYLVAKYGLERAMAAYELNKARLSKLYITAPHNGYVNNRLYDLGAYTLPMTPIFDFIDNAYMKITTGVAERFINDIKLGTPVEITFDAFPELRIQSEVSFINRSIDPASRTFQIEMKIPNPERKLAPQMIANVKLLRRSYEDDLVIPLDTVIETENGRFVFIASNDEKAVRIPIDFLAIYEDSVLVHGLQVDQRLIITGQQELTEGDQLLIQQD
jgi:membrane fusion protein (multidrug efflux system)